jgi:hypothetical protein
MAVCLVEWTVDRAGAVLAGAVLAGAVAAALVGGVVFMVAVAAAVVAACTAGVAVVVATGWAGAAGAAEAGVCTRGGSARLWRDAPLGARAVGAAPVGALVGKDVVVDVFVGELAAVVPAIATTAMVSTSREADCVLAGVSGSATAAAAEARRRKARMSVALGVVEVERSWLLNTSHPSFSSPALRAAIVCGAVALNGVR